MKAYEKPVVLRAEELAEGVYLASGGVVGENCYTVGAQIHQTPQEGRGDFRIQVDATHAASNKHHSGAQVLTLSFNQPVTYVSSNGTLQSGDGTSTIQISYSYHNNANEFIGLGDVVVTANPGLAITGAKLSCNYDCGEHEWWK